MIEDRFDLIVIGGGPGGYVAAIRASQLGFKTALIERDELGGICLNWGCMPTKSLLRSVDVLRLLKSSQEFGVTVESVTVDIHKMVERSRNISAQLGKGVSMLLRKNNVTVIKGEGKLLGNNQVLVKSAESKKTISADHIILATGAKARSLANMPIDGKYIWSYREALIPKEIPKKMIILGAGAIGIEFACFYNAIGSEVTIIELSDNILPQSDYDVIHAMTNSLTDDGIRIITGKKMNSYSICGNKIHVEISAANEDIVGEVLVADVVLQAIGIDSNIQHIGLENTMIEIEKGHIVTDQFCKTNETNVYAIGDVAGPPWLAHKASYEGIMCVEKIAGMDAEPLQATRVPSCIYSHPQVASIGYTEKEAKSLNLKVKVGISPFIANGKALAMGEKEGFVKVLFHEETGELLGAHMIGNEVTEMINGYIIAQSLETTEEDLMGTIFAHPTMSEAMHEAVLAAYNQAIHQ